MQQLIETAYRGAQFAYQVSEGADSPDKLDEALINYMNGGGFDVVDVLCDTCREAVDAAEDLSRRPQEEQAAIWRALGILETAVLMPEFWQLGFTHAPYQCQARSAPAEADEWDWLKEVLDD